MKLTLAIAGVMRVPIDVAPLPSGVDAILVWMWGDCWRSLPPSMQCRLVRLASEYSERARRDVMWFEVDGGHAWCGPIAYGGELHIDLWQTLPMRIALSGGIVAIDWRTGAEIAFAPPVTTPAPRPLDEDDDDNALSLNGRLDALAAMGAP